MTGNWKKFGLDYQSWRRTTHSQKVSVDDLQKIVFTKIQKKEHERHNKNNDTFKYSSHERKISVWKLTQIQFTIAFRKTSYLPTHRVMFFVITTHKTIRNACCQVYWMLVRQVTKLWNNYQWENLVISIILLIHDFPFLLRVIENDLGRLTFPLCHRSKICC